VSEFGQPPLYPGLQSTTPTAKIWLEDDTFGRGHDGSWKGAKSRTARILQA
jgi:hypothetical protein